MTNPYNRVGFTTRMRQLALAVLFTGGASAAHAQALPYVAANVSNTVGTYTDLGTTGTAIAVANNDDANSAAQPIGFTFNYNGTAFTDFVLNTNGFIKLGTVAPAGPMFSMSTSDPAGGPAYGTENNLILPFNQDLDAGTAGGTEFRVATTGTAPNRVCTIQWKNVKDKVDTQYSNFSFQVKLFETSNQISFVYGTATPATAGTDNFKFVTVGIKGSGTAANQIILGTKGSVQPWSATTFVGGLYTGNAHNIRRSVLPDAGRTYSFTIPVANDAAVQAVYAFDKLAVPAGQPVVIRAAIRNAGTAALGNFTVTLNVTGANTVSATTTVASLAVGATTTVVFPAVAVPNVGNNTVTVSVPADGNTTNNTSSMLMETTPNTTGFITANQPAASAFGFGAGAQDNYFGAKITFTQPRDITAVNAFLFNDPNAVGSSVYGVVIDATSGALLGRSPAFVVTTASLNQLRTFTMTAPVSVPAGDVIVGMATVAAPGAVQFFLMGVQAENPTRPGTFFTGSATTAGAPTASLTGANALYKYMLEAVTATPATCAVPTGLTATGTQTSASISFTGPANGTSYQIVYGPTGFNPATGGTTVNNITSSPYNVTGLAASTCYQFYIRTVCSATDQSVLGGPVTFCTPCAPPIIIVGAGTPYSENFDVVGMGQSLPCGVTVQDVNNDGNTWRARATVPTSANPNTPIGRGGMGNAMVYFYNEQSNTIGGDDWFYTPGLRLNGGQRYRLSFYLRSAGASFPEGLEVKYGPGTTPATQTTTLYTNTSVVNPAYALATNNSTPAVADMQPATTGVYYVGFHAISAPDQFFLAVDDISVALVSANSAALTRAVSVFPNPSASGRFNLEVNNANAKQALAVEVTNSLGQRVYAGTAKDNFRNDLDLSGLASGIYTLKVKNGSEYTIQQISIVK